MDVVRFQPEINERKTWKAGAKETDRLHYYERSKTEETTARDSEGRG